MKPAVYKIRVPNEVAELIRSLHPQLKRKVKASLTSIQKNPRSGKALRGELEGLWSTRVSRLRLIYRIGRRRRIELIALGPRERIYEETLRLVRKDPGVGS
jgi:mRNA interferase RelE/StbE